MFNAKQTKGFAYIHFNFLTLTLTINPLLNTNENLIIDSSPSYMVCILFTIFQNI
jgi:hypothetical protein